MSDDTRLGKAVIKARKRWKSWGEWAEWVITAPLQGADLTGADLTGLDLSGKDFRGTNLTGADLTDADLEDADLTGADLTDAILTGADLKKAILTGAILTGALGLPHAPCIPDLSAQILATVTATPSAWNMWNWHDSCGTAHCWAGHIAKKAGQAGRALENKYGTALAAALICVASEPGLPIPGFYSMNTEALQALRDRVARGRQEEEK